jgi:hypothetical protein
VFAKPIAIRARQGYRGAKRTVPRTFTNMPIGKIAVVRGTEKALLG